MPKHLCIAIAAIALVGAARAQDPAASAPAVRPASAPASLLGERFEARSAGIALNPPADMQRLVRPGAVENVAQFINEQRKSTLVITRVVLAKPMGMLTKAAGANQPTSRPGLLDLQETQLAAPPLSGRILRKDLINAGRNGTLQVGMLAARYAVGPQRFLRQQALIRYDLQRVSGTGPQPAAPETESDTERAASTYFLVDYTTPSSKEGDDTEPVDAQERRAVEVFSQLLDTVELFDLRPLVRDAEERLYRTRNLLYNINETRVRRTLLAEQAYLIRQEGKEIGYTYATEEIGNRDGQSGVVLLMRTRTYPSLLPAPEGAPPAARPQRTEAVSEMFSTIDRKAETWATIVNHSFGKDHAANEQLREVGTTTFERIRTFEEERGPDGRPVLGPDGQPLKRLGPDRAPLSQMQDRYTLTVNQFTRSASQPPVERQLPPFYLPQAMSQMLPRLLPLDEPKGYLFAVWVQSERQIIRRYVDVEPDRRANIDGRSLQVIPVKDRIGLEGVPTWHYFTPDGRYLGSVNEQAKLSILVSTPEAIRKLWPDADLTVPKVMTRSTR